MSETLEQRLRRLAKEDNATLCQVYPGDVVELLDARDFDIYMLKLSAQNEEIDPKAGK